MKQITLLLVSLLVSSIGYSQSSWKKSTSSGEINGSSIELYKADKSFIYELDLASFKQHLDNTQKRGEVSLKNSNNSISLPNEKGIIEEFKILEASTFSPTLAAKFPEIKSYIGYSTSSKATARISISPEGIQSMISYPNKETIFMQPIKGDNNKYIVYSRAAKENIPTEPFVCYTENADAHQADSKSIVDTKDANDQVLRKFRLAMSVNGEYTTYHGGTVAGALAAINATMTRVNAVFETDMAVTFEIIDATELIYTDAATDPYSTDLGEWNAQLQNTLSNTIGNAAYDIGHMFGASGGGGNAGCIGCVCVDDDIANTSDTEKGSGITSPIDAIPEGDSFDIDFVAHEIGHQMGANHTWAFRSEGTGVNAEPGSGSTIMGYAGITNANDVQSNSDAYFHYHSIKQITDNLVTRTCWEDNSPVAIANNPPNAEAGNDYTIPMGTAYVLKGAATDADGGDNLTYCWEQTDSAIVTNTSFGPTSTSGAMARSLPPVASPNRYIPRLSSVVSGNLTQSSPTLNSPWETVATVGRTLNWALTVRDREPSNTGLGGQSSYDTMTVTVDDTAGPFAVTSQTTNETWDIGESKLVTWDVAGTDGGSVNTPTVNILLSVDGGLTFPHVIASNVPNNGNALITVPTIGSDTTTARIIVEGNDNIFFAMNSSDFTINVVEFSLAINNLEQDICSPNDATYTFIYNTFSGFSDTTTFSATNLPAGASINFNPATATATNTTVTATVSGTSSIANGAHTFSIVGTSGPIDNTIDDIIVNIYNSTIEIPSLTTPANGANDISLSETLTWEANSNTGSYLIEVATDNSFSTIITSTQVETNSYVGSFDPDVEYFWRVTPSNICGTGTASNNYSFRTINCGNFDATDLPIDISSSGSSGVYTSTITIAQNLTITDVNVIFSAEHTFNGDLDITLTSPAGTEIELSTDNGGSSNDYTNTVFDQEATDLITDGTAPFTGMYRPEGDLSSLNGEMAAGDWILTVADDAGGDGGVFTQFGLQLCFASTLSNNSFNAPIKDLVVYPNPSNGEFNITFDADQNDEEVAIQLFDLRGRMLTEKTYRNTAARFSEKVNFVNVNSGVYFVRITNGDKQSTKKLIIN